MAFYNPVVRSYARLRSEMARAADLPRRRVRPHGALVVLLPRSGRRAAWARMKQSGLKLPPLELSPPARRFVLGVVLLGAGAVALGVQAWAGLLAVVPLGLLAFRVSRPWAVKFPLGLRTAGELALYLIRFNEHRESGYRWTSNEVTTKVRMVIAESLGLPLDRVRPECTWAELGAD